MNPLANTSAIGRTKPVRRLDVAWKFRLRSQGVYAAETRIIEDAQGNYLFGAHDGNVYSVSASGRLNWTFGTKLKIYPSPILIGTRLFVLTGGGDLLCIDGVEGLLVWQTRVADRPRTLGLLSDAVLWASFATYDYDPQQKRQLRAWGSPNSAPDGRVIYCVARGTGLTAVAAEDGGVLWRYALGGLPHHLAGPVVAMDGTIYAVAQRGEVHAVSPEGRRIWKRRPSIALNAWGGLSLDEPRKRLYVASSWRNHTGLIEAMDLDGKTLWSRRLGGALRGSVAIWPDGLLYVACGDGRLYALAAEDGRVVHLAQVGEDPSMITLWTTPVITQNDVLLSAVLDRRRGRFCVFAPDLTPRMSMECGKALSPPLSDSRDRLLFGSWDNHLYCVETD